MQKRMPAGLELQQLYDEHAQALFAFLLNFTHNEHDTRDVLQDIFIKLARQPALLSGVREPRAFLLRLAHNSAIDLVRRHDTRDKYHAELGLEQLFAFVPDDNPDERAFREALTAALGELPKDQRAVVHLKLWENLTFDQIAQTLEIPPNTAASRYRYGVDKLQARLRPLSDEIK